MSHEPVQVCGECLVPWPCPASRTVRQCANERCNNEFDDRRPQAIYCSRLCAKAQGERQRRRRKAVQPGGHPALR